MFADIVGFTAWSSVREPTQVFTLLETVYHAFDEIARRRRVFKVETVGDCYVAVVGLPDPRPDHPIVMARFARECLTKMNQLTKKLEVQLGPDTGDLSMRIGIHSGPVTAGVLRGDKSRFQLFGDTVNTAARMESTGERNRIHLSYETAKLLIGSNKGHWLKQRTDLVQAKGKGVLQTYWLDSLLRSSAKSSSGKSDKDGSNSKAAVEDTKFVEGGWKLKIPSADQKLQRLIGWNTDVLGRLIKQIIARRNAAAKLGRIRIDDSQVLELPPQEMGKTVLDEVKEVIHLPAFDAVVLEKQEDPNGIILNEAVMDQLKDFVGMIASLYRENSFHNFEHASHVTMSVVKLLSRITTADALTEKTNRDAHSLHDVCSISCIVCDQSFDLHCSNIFPSYHPAVYLRDYIRSVDPVCMCLRGSHS
jgi:class 3 adenylate cyclase